MPISNLLESHSKDKEQLEKIVKKWRKKMDKYPTKMEFVRQLVNEIYWLGFMDCFEDYGFLKK